MLQIILPIGTLYEAIRRKHDPERSHEPKKRMMSVQTPPIHHISLHERVPLMNYFSTDQPSQIDVTIIRVMTRDVIFSREILGVSRDIYNLPSRVGDDARHRHVMLSHSSNEESLMKHSEHFSEPWHVLLSMIDRCERKNHGIRDSLEDRRPRRIIIGRRGKMRISTYSLLTSVKRTMLSHRNPRTDTPLQKVQKKYLPLTSIRVLLHHRDDESVFVYLHSRILHYPEKAS